MKLLGDKPERCPLKSGPLLVHVAIRQAKFPVRYHRLSIDSLLNSITFIMLAVIDDVCFTCAFEFCTHSALKGLLQYLRNFATPGILGDLNK